MKKYKLIKEYPGSRNLGTIIEKDSEIRWNPLDFPQFWKEIIEKDYKILAFKIGNHIITKTKKGYWEDNTPNTKYYSSTRGEKFMLNNPNTYKIHSVKRLSDGEIFTISDELTFYPENKSIGKIDKFLISHEQLRVDIGNMGQVLCHDIDKRNNIIKYKKPLFITEDGVKIFEQTTSITFIRNFVIMQDIHKYNDISESELKEYMLFSNYTAAREYILLNKPCLSINNVLKNWKYRKSLYLNTKALEELVQSKIE